MTLASLIVRWMARAMARSSSRPPAGVAGLGVLMVCFCAAVTAAAQTTERQVLAAPFAAEQGRAWYAQVPSDWASDDTSGEHSRLVLLEDGVPLGPAHGRHADIRALGSGRYSHWNGGLYFSTSDDSDPNTNGHTYIIEWTALPPGQEHYRVLPSRDPFVLLSDDALARGVAGREPPGTPAEQAPRLVYWYTIDALRADTARMLVDGAPLMPNLAAFAEQSVNFSHAYVQASFTKMSTASMFTGLWPQRHGVMHGVIEVWPRGAALTFDLDRRFYTLAEFFDDFGYATWTHLYTVHVEPGCGLLQGFAHTDLASSQAEPLPTVPPGGLFAYEHILGLHAPYNPSPAARARLALPPATSIDPASTDWFYQPLGERQLSELQAAYLGEAHDADLRLGQRLDWIRDQGLWDDAVIIVTSDHGEEFLEHGATQHSVQLYDEVLRVPLLIRFPQKSSWARRHGENLAQRVRLVDLFPTLVELVGGEDDELPYVVDGKSLGPILEGREIDPFLRDVYARTSFTSEVEGQGGTALYVSDAVIAGRQKALLGYRIRSSQGGAGWDYSQGDWFGELYNIAADPGETNDQAATRSGAFSQFADRLKAQVRPLLARGQVLKDADSALLPDVDPDMLQRLRELGYLGDE